MNLTIPWRPSQNGNDLSPCALYNEVVASGAVPLEAGEPEWAKKRVFPTLSDKAGARPPLWESILAIWRLKQRDEQGGDDLVWQGHVSAWLVRRSGLYPGS
jgi:hypothetical protein